MSPPDPGIVQSTEDRAADRPLWAGLPLIGSRRTAARGGSPHASKFRVATVALTSIAVVAVVIAMVILAHHGSSGSSQPWSSWTPTVGGQQGASEIAQHVAPFYRLSAAQQLDVVTLVNLANANDAGTTSGSGLTVALGSSNQDLSLLEGETIAFNLCGLGGSNCQIGGTPSSDRLLLVRREALELALYTFKYVSGVENVVCILPPGRTETTSTLSPTPPPAGKAIASSQPETIAVLFDRQELAPFLAAPLSETLSEFPPAISQLSLWSQTEEAGIVDQITARGLFSERIESQQDGGNLLVLDPLPPQ